MNKSHYPKTLNAAAWSLALSASALHAQTSGTAGPDGTEDDRKLDPLVVQGESPASNVSNEVDAFKTQTPIRDVPQSLTIFTNEQIKKQAIFSLGDIVDYTPGVNTSQGEGHRDSIVFRGVRSTADFFADGVRDDVQYYRPLYNIEKVEILRGPSALYFGRGGTGGVLNRVMKKAEIGEQFNEYETSIDTFGQYTLQFDTNQSFADNAAFRLNFHYDDLANHRDHYYGERFGINPTLTYKVSDATTLRFSYEYMDHERFIDRGIPTGADGRPVSSFGDIVFGDSKLNYSTLEAHILRFDVEHEFSDAWKATGTVSYGEYDKFYQNFYVSGYDEAATPDEVTLDGYADQTTRRNFVLSGNLIGEFETGNFGHKLLLGAEFNHTSSDQNRFNSFWDTTMDDNEVFSVNNFRLSGGSGFNSNGILATNNFNTDLADDTRVDIDVYSFYLQDEIALNRCWDLVLGARFDSFEIDVFNADNGERRSRRDQEVSPRLGLVYKPLDNLSFYGSYSETFEPRSGEQYANINGDNDRLDPNTFTNLEVGVKWDIRDNLSFTLSAFEIERSSQEVSDLDASQFVTVDSDITGFEAQIRGQVTDRWFISAGYSYLDGEQVDQDGDTGLRPRELPRHTFSVWNNYQVTDKFGLGLGVIYQDESFIDNGNNAELPSYVRVDAAAYYDISENFRVQLNVENVFDTDYYPNAHSTHQVTVGAPIHARLGFTGRF
ncbi:ligand-gated channel protein [Oceaniferula spumae]|uniref:Ligand-gated channel protein n=1 Tax=Oceaniferula spumae TaxID=2979115 RepID=A0AAT9FQ73_9BACT